MVDPSPSKPVLRSTVMVCTLIVEQLSDNGATQKTVTYKKANLTLGRNQFRDLILHVEGNKAVFKFSLRNCNVHKRFMSEGKATIDLPEQKRRLMISNAPPNTLLVLLKVLVGKKAASGGKENKALAPSAIRQRLLSIEPNAFDEISPLTVKEYQSIRKGEPQKRSADATASPVSTKRFKGENPTPNSLSDRFKASPSPLNPIILSAEQNRVLRAVQSGQNVFFTGSAGTGKSFLLKKVVGALPPNATAVTASTGVAACHLNGTTLHAFAGIGSGDAPLEQCIIQAKRKHVLQNWKRCQHLIIDEISMVDGKFFQKLESVARAVRNSDKPFGGIQLILCGDFLQLPPVCRSNNASFAFQSKAWDSCINLNIELREVRRQDDEKFINVLQEIRHGRCSNSSSDILRSTSSHQLSQNGILATRLCTHREDVTHINGQHLNKLTGEKKVFTATDSDPAYATQLDTQTGVLSKLLLKVGAQVMLMKNLSVSDGLVNGARGVIRRYTQSGYPEVEFVCGVTKEISPEKWTVSGIGGLQFSRRQLPLKLAWAFSIHKSQGMTLDLVEMSLSRVFEAGQAYVALSRARNLKGLRVLDFSPSCIKANPNVLKFYRSLEFESAPMRQIKINNKT